MNVISYIREPWRIPLVLQYKGLGKLIPDDIYLKCLFRESVGCKLNLRNPQLFGEKLQWLKLYDRKRIYSLLVDKYEVKKIVGDIIGEQYIIPSYGVWERFDDIDFELLPNQFVLKCTHDSGGIVICKDKVTFDFEHAKQIIEKSLKNNYYMAGREWPYKNVKPRIIAEAYMVNRSKEILDCQEESDLRDYKFYCFSGKALYCQVIRNRTSKETIDFFDMNWIHQELRGFGLPLKPNSDTDIPYPRAFLEMKEKAEILANGYTFLRVDFYEVDGKMYFGEITFYPSSGLGSFEPVDWNIKLGNLIKLPTDKQ